MSRWAWAYIGAVLFLSALLSGMATVGAMLAPAQWLPFSILVVLATFAQFLEVKAPNRQSYYPTMVFFFAGLLLLPLPLFVLIVVIPHLFEWVRARLTDSSHLKSWYIQPFNIANHILAGFAAYGVHGLVDASGGLVATPLAVAAAIIGAMVYVLINHLLIGEALVLARGLGWRESGILAPDNLLTDLIMVLLGYILAVLWQVNPWLSVPALAPLVLMYRALLVPRLRQEAQTDGKTGLYNARHFATLFEAELARAQRFNRPLGLIIADLDLLRAVNNTYGHLAGDIVLAGIGEIIRRTVRGLDITARFGGEEFVIALPETEPAAVQVIAERLREAVAAARFPVPTSTTPISVTMSLGVACCPGDASEATTLIHEADIAVYQAKLQGRNRVVLAADVPAAVKSAILSGGGGAVTTAATTFVEQRQPADEAGYSPRAVPGRRA